MSFYPKYSSEISRFKTEKWRFRYERGFWSEGKNWKYAHGNSELRYVDEPVPKYAKRLYKKVNIEFEDNYVNKTAESSNESSDEYKERYKKILEKYHFSQKMHDILSKDSANEIRSLSKKVDKLKIDSNKKDKIIEQQSIESERRLYDDNSRATDLKYKSVLRYTINQLESLLQWTIDLWPLKDPNMLPSGNTINGSFMQKLINNKSPDPFDNTKQWKELIKNRIAIEALEILEKIKMKNQVLHKEEEIAKKLIIKSRIDITPQNEIARTAVTNTEEFPPTSTRIPHRYIDLSKLK